MTDGWKKILDINQWIDFSPPASQQAHEIDLMLLLVHWFMLVLFVVWTAFFISILWRFRRSRNAKADYQGFKGHHTTYAEVGVVVLEAVMLLLLAFPVWAKRVNQFPPESEAIEVRVIAQQFAWNFQYPGLDGKFGRRDAALVSGENFIGLDRTDPAAKDDIVTMNNLYLPVHRDALVHITSKDVIHSFAIRQMRVCQDAIPGLSIPAWFKPTVTTAEIKSRVGREDYEFEIMCAQLCGNSHYRMRGVVHVQTQEEFDAWVAAESASALEESSAPAEEAGSEYE